MAEIIQIPKNFEESDFYKQWFVGLKTSSKKKSLSKAMKAVYRSAMKQFLKFVNSKGLNVIVTPDILIEEAKLISEDKEGKYGIFDISEEDSENYSGPQKMLQTLYYFEDWLQGNDVKGYEKRKLIANERFLQSGTSHQRAHGVIRGFFSHNRLWLPKARSEEPISKTRQNDQNHAVFLPNGEGEIIADWEEFRYWISQLNFRDQVVALCLVSSSQDVGDLLSLNMGFVKRQEKKERLFWEGLRNKNNQPFRTFFSKEATQWLKKYISTERQNAKDEEAIFVNNKNIPLQVYNVTENFRFATQKIGIEWNEKDEEGNKISLVQCPYRPKRLRSIFSTACSTAKIDIDAKYIFMGHKRNVSQHYRNMPFQNLELIYREVEKFVTVFGDIGSEEAKAISKKALSKVVKIEVENEKLKKEISELKIDLEKVMKFKNNLELITKGQLSDEQKKVLLERKSEMITLFEQSIITGDTNYEALGPYLETFMMPLVKLEFLFKESGVKG